MSRLSKNINNPATLILKEIDFDDTIRRRVHKTGNQKKRYGKIYLPPEWINREVYVGLVRQNGSEK